MANRAASLVATTRRHPDKVAIHFQGRAISFAELLADIWAAAGGLAQLGIGRGTHVGLLLPACPDFIIIQQALFALGAVVTPLNTHFRAGEINHAANSCDLTFLVANNELADALIAQGLTLPPGCALIRTDGAGQGQTGGSLRSALATSQPIKSLAQIDPKAPALLLLTSATTGKAKGVALSADNLAANYDRTPDWLGLGSDTMVLSALPLYNTFGLNQCINAMAVAGATLVLMPRFDAGACIQAVTDYGCSFLPAVPTMLQKILDHPTASAEALAPLRRIMTGGAPVPEAFLKRLLAVAPQVKLFTGYGLTEACALVTLSCVQLGPDGDVEHGRTIGRVLDGVRLAIVDEAGAPLPTGSIGEIVVAGPNVMTGYHRAPADTAMALRNGWLHTGDIGYLDEDGNAYIVDRKKDVIIRGGQNIYPADIEEALYGVPGVAEAAVIGRPDDLLGEVPVAFVALREGVDLPAETLLAHCRTFLATYKVPVSLQLMAELPKGPTGKILRRALRQAPAETASVTE